jgi:calcineurin-like phosphoesterase family protein
MYYYLICDDKNKLLYFYQGGVESMGTEEADVRDEGSLLLLHLSDIHFREPYCLKPDTDPDHAIRMALRNDIRRMVAQLGNVDAILISGDIAFKANAKEYGSATKWINEVVNDAGCCETDVYTVPGNHDVNRVTATERSIDGLKKGIFSKSSGYNRDKDLQDALGEEGAGPLLIKPMYEYNQFAAPFRCDIDSNEVFWTEELNIAPGWILKMHGVTTTLFSGPEDKKGSLYLGALQRVFPIEDGVVRLALMHHPPAWLDDEDAFDDALNEGCVLQLHGHKHRQRISDPSQSARIGAGAVNPDRSEKSWTPSYNLIKLQMLQEEEPCRLQIDIHQRTWQDSPDCFVSKKKTDGKSVFTHYVCLQNRPLPVKKKQLEESFGNGRKHSELKNGSEVKVPSEDKTSQRSLVYSFWLLSNLQRRDIMMGLGLITTKDMQLPEPKRYRLAFERAGELNIINELKEAIYNAVAN